MHILFIVPHFATLESDGGGMLKLLHPDSEVQLKPQYSCSNGSGLTHYSREELSKELKHQLIMVISHCSTSPHSSLVCSLLR